MADIFISYSKSDRDLVLKLSAFLEAEGWSVWWDNSLEAADKFRDVIMKELATARTVITIWTETSITSDWVRAEAGRAKADGKLIPVKTSAVAYADIPLPFGEMHTDDVTATELIRAAVVAQLAKPAVAPSPLRTSVKALRYQALTWGGILGGAITLFTSLSSILRMADWARWLVTHWHEWMHGIWSWAFSWISIQIPPELAPGFSFLIFMLMLSIGIKLRTKMLAKGPQLNSYHVRRPVMTLLFGLMIQTIFIATVMIIDRYFEFVGPMFNFIDRSLGREVGDIVSTVVFQTTLSIPLAIFVIWLSTEKMKSIYSYSLCSLFSLIMVALPFLSITSRSHTSEQVAGTLIVFQLFVFPIAILALVIFTPLSALTRRLWSVAIGLTFLMMLNELSKFGLHFLLEGPK